MKVLKVIALDNLVSKSATIDVFSPLPLNKRFVWKYSYVPVLPNTHKLTTDGPHGPPSEMFSFVHASRVYFHWYTYYFYVWFNEID